MTIRTCRVRNRRSLKRSNGVNAVMVRLHIRFSAVLAVALALAGCGRSESYRYKLTLAVNTADGVKRGSSVAEVTFFEVSIPARGIMHKLRGEALYLDLGPGAPPLIALIGRQTQPSSRQWRPTTQLSRLYDIPLSADVMDTLAQIARKRGARTIAPNELPDLVTFANVNDPSTVTEVDPNNLQATLAPGVNWNEITLEVTDEPITKGIEEKLPWIPYYSCFMLDGARYQDKNTLANSLSTADFDQSDDAMKKIKQKLSSTDIGSECWKSLREWQQRPR
ncbi:MULTISPECIES: hypothetical protein [unclassified Bradyrhizobium]|uniref:hypothetical protein n=1 Tax=unclassified Bradyrhizobium TaxID=2631580 RepID=UPI002FF0807F